jgi:hypothetical protein
MGGMAISVTAPAWIRLNGKECEVEVIGYCTRDLRGKVDCQITKILTTDGLDIFGVVPQDDLAALHVRLWCQHISNAHPGGEPEAAV